MNDTVPVRVIKANVAAAFGCPVAALEGHRRDIAIARPRQIVMYLARVVAHRSFPEIGKALGDRDHSTVINGCRKIKQLIETDKAIAGIVARLKTELESGDLSMHCRYEAIRFAKNAGDKTEAFDPEQLRIDLRGLYEERLVATAVNQDYARLELFANRNGSWSLVEIATRNNIARFVASGWGWQAERVDDTLTASLDVPLARPKPSRSVAAARAAVMKKTQRKPVLPPWSAERNPPPKEDDRRERKQRTCLGCGCDFPSAHAGNRQCPRCKAVYAKAVEE